MPFKNPHPLYSTWRSMRDRCMNPNFRQWADYGGRGIKVCERWNDFHAFAADMGPRPEGHSIDRIDNDGDYTPENCRWATRKQQQRNRRAAVYVEIDGQKYLLAELAEMSGLRPTTVKARVAQGMSYEQVICPTRRRGGAVIGIVGPLARKKKAAAKTHCRDGHRLTEENTYVTKQGWRVCRTCHNAKMRRLNAAKRATG
jgi:hypothetical protein